MSRIVFAGTPAFSVPILQALFDAGHEICAVYTQPDRPKGRGRRLSPSPVKELALKLNIPVFQPEKLTDEKEIQHLIEHNCDWLIVAAYGLILSKAVLAIPKNKPINVHASLLPRWRGASPIQQAILAGDEESGVTIMEMVRELDAGDMLHKQSVVLASDETTETLHDRLSVIGAEVLLEYLGTPDAFTPITQSQGEVTYAGKIMKSDARLDFTKTAEQLCREVRAYQPWPVSSLQWEGKHCRIWSASYKGEDSSAQPGEILRVSKTGIEVATSDGVFVIERWQQPGGKPLMVSEFLRAHASAILPGETVFS